MIDFEYGRKLRGKVDNFQDVLTDVEEYMKNCSVFDVIDGDWENNAMELIENIMEQINDLFYFIPIKNRTKKPKPKREE